jgi:uncharacterized repeat protein (TIGR01451 family)
MKQKFSGIRSTAIRTFIAGFAVLALLAFALPQAAQARTSGGATIYNTVKVNYTSGTTTLFATANCSVTVNTVGAQPTVTNPVGQTTVAGGAVTYVYKVASNSNGYDTYNTSVLTNTATNVGAATATSVTASVNLWGGITVGASGAGTIQVPFGSTSQLTAGTSTVQIGASTYTVATITAGSAASTDGSGNLIAEVPATLALTLISGTAITAGSVTAGTQVGEYKTAALTAALTAGTPSTPGTDGTYSTFFTINEVASGGSALVTTGVTTTVSSPKATITKTVSPTTGVVPGTVLTYTITVTNPHPTASITSVTVIDHVPAYTTYVASSTLLNTKTVSGDGATSPLVAGILVDSNAGRTGGTVATGILAAGTSAVITYSVTVN